MPEYRVFLPEILSDVPGCPDVTVEDKAELTVRDFCDQTEVWQEWRDIYIDPDVDNYTLTPPPGSEINIVTKVVSNNIEIRAAPSPGPGLDDNNYDAPAGSVYSGWSFNPPNYLRLSGVPQSESVLFVKMALRPKAGHGSFPDWIWNRYKRFLISGVLARLLMQRGMTWSEPNLALVHQREYQRGIARSRIDKVKGFSNKSLRVKFKRFI